MEKYYVIPITDSSILIKGANSIYIPLSEYVSKYYPRLMKLEEKRNLIIFNENINSAFTELDQLRIESIERQKIEISKTFQIPLNLLAVGNSVRAFEIVTNEMVCGLGGETSYFSTYQESEETFHTYYNSEYIHKVKRFINRRNFELIDFRNYEQMAK